VPQFDSGDNSDQATSFAKFVLLAVVDVCSVSAQESKGGSVSDFEWTV
jgi:hypothetical protein